jgi:hypothetical protein
MLEGAKINNIYTKTSQQNKCLREKKLYKRVEKFKES